MRSEPLPPISQTANQKPQPFPFVKANPPFRKSQPCLFGKANLPFVIPTGAKRSGGICGFTLGRNETRKRTEPFPIRTSSLGSTDLYQNSFHPYRKMQIETPNLPFVIPTGAEGSAVSLSDASKLANALSHFPFALPR